MAPNKGLWWKLGSVATRLWPSLAWNPSCFQQSPGRHLTPCAQRDRREKGGSGCPYRSSAVEGTEGSLHRRGWRAAGTALGSGGGGGGSSEHSAFCPCSLARLPIPLALRVEVFRLEKTGHSQGRTADTCARGLHAATLTASEHGTPIPEAPRLLSFPPKKPEVVLKT